MYDDGGGGFWSANQVIEELYENTTWVFIFQKIWQILKYFALGHFIKHKPLICCVCLHTKVVHTIFDPPFFQNISLNRDLG